MIDNIQQTPKKLGNLTLKEYLKSYNYKREVQNSGKKSLNGISKKSEDKNVFINVPKTPSTIKYQNQLDKQAHNIKLFARELIKNDNDFIELEKMIECMKQTCVKKLQEERNNKSIIQGIIEMSANKTNSSTIRNQSVNQNSKQKTFQNKEIKSNLQSTIIYTGNQLESAEQLELLSKFNSPKNDNSHNIKYSPFINSRQMKLQANKQKKHQTIVGNFFLGKNAQSNKNSGTV